MSGTEPSSFSTMRRTAAMTCERPTSALAAASAGSVTRDMSAGVCSGCGTWMPCRPAS